MCYLENIRVRYAVDENIFPWQENDLGVLALTSKK